MSKSEWGFCKDCKWWQIEPDANIANTVLGLCIDEDLQEYRLRVSGNSGCNRFMEGRPALKFYEAGLDLELADDPEESFRIYQGMIRAEYEQLVKEFDLVRMNATDTLVRQQKQMRELVMPHLKGVMRADGGSIRDTLKEQGLRGRYLLETLRKKQAQA